MNERNLCCCIYHVEMEELLYAFTQLRIKYGIHDKVDCTCQCEVCLTESNVEHCVARVFLYHGLTTISDAVLCPKAPYSTWHSKNCLFGDCLSCGVDILPMCPTEEDGLSPNIVQWKHYKMHVLKVDVDKEHEYDCEPIHRCKDLHFIRYVGSMEVGKLLKLNLACFCFSCIEGNLEECENRASAGDWMLEVLVPLNATYVQNA